MDIDLDLYRRDVRVAHNPDVKLSLIDIAPEFPLRTMVFIHGFGGEAMQWRYQLREFALENRVIALDLRGHGYSDHPAKEYRMERVVDDVIASLDVLGVTGKITLLGHSFGGAIATEFAVRYPERVEFLILIATAGEFKLNPAYRASLQLPPVVLAAFTRPTRGWLNAPPDILRLWYQENLRKWNGWKLFELLRMPTLVIRGHRDFLFEKQFFDGVAKLIPDADEVNVGHSGHMVMIERRDAVNREIERFISASHRSWREEASDKKHSQLIATRPWLSQYSRNVPSTVAIPMVPVYELLNSAVRRFPTRNAIEFEGQILSYRELSTAVEQFAHCLRALGIKTNDKVFVFLNNQPALVITFYAILKVGGVAVFTTPDATPEDIIEQVNTTESRFLIMSQVQEMTLQHLQSIAFLEKIIVVDPKANPRLKQAIIRRSPHQYDDHDLREKFATQKILDFNSLLSAFGPTSIENDVNPRRLAVIAYTGGTTSKPKGVMLSHRNLVANAIQVRHWMPDASAGKEVFLCVLPLTHSYGLTTALNVPVSLGATLILKETFNTVDVLKSIRRLRPTIFPGVPAMYMAINNTPDVRSYGIDSIKYCISGSSPLPIEVQESFERITKARLVEGYGLTEASPVTHANPLGGTTRVGSIGLPLPSTEAQIVDLTRVDRSVPVGQIGELAIRGPQVMLGYFKDPDGTQQVLTRNGWLLTGDVVQMDPNGYFHLIARKIDMWYPKRAGEPAFPRDVEEVIYEIPQVREVVVVAVAGQPIAFILAAQERPETESVLAYCKRRLPPELVPRIVIFVDDFPRSFIGKVLRRELTKRYSEKLGSEK